MVARTKFADLSDDLVQRRAEAGGRKVASSIGG